MELNKWRLMHLAAAEAVDAWRIVPRLMVAGYAYMLAYMIYWYMQLKPYVLEECVKALGPDVAASITHCIIQEPSTQHTALITAVVGISAGVFGFYANSGRAWTQGVFKWPIKPGEAPPPQYQQPMYPSYPNYPTYPTTYEPGGYDPSYPYGRPQTPPGGAPSAPPASAKPPPGNDI
jgi:hypothetical protein